MGWWITWQCAQNCSLVHAFFGLGDAITDEALASLSLYLTEHIYRFGARSWISHST